MILKNLIPLIIQLILLEQVWTQDLLGIGRLTGNIQTEVVRRFVEMFRSGMIQAKLGNMTVPDTEWVIDSSYMHTVIKSSDARVIGLTAFNMRNLSKIRGLTQLDMAMDLEIPMVHVTGNYKADATFLKLIPVVGGGEYSIKLYSIQVKGGGHLKLSNFGTAAKINVIDPHLSVNGLALSFEGFPSQMYMMCVFIILSFSLAIYTIIIVVITSAISGRKKKSVKSKKEPPIALLETTDNCSY